MKPTTLPHARDAGADGISRFVELSVRFCEVLERYGIPFRPYESETLPHFSRLPREHRLLVLASLEETLATWSEAEANGESLRDTTRLLWRTIRRLGMTPQSDLFDKIEDGDVVEIYTADMRQLFRNLNFFRFFSCTLEELVSVALPELAEVPPEVLTFLAGVAARLGAGAVKHTFVPDVRPYVIREKVGVERIRTEVAIKWMSPLMEGGRSVALVVVNRSRYA